MLLDVHTFNGETHRAGNFTMDAFQNISFHKCSTSSATKDEKLTTEVESWTTGEQLSSWLLGLGYLPRLTYEMLHLTSRTFLSVLGVAVVIEACRRLCRAGRFLS